MEVCEKCGADTYICQLCGQVLCSKEKPLQWRPEITGSARAGNICPDCLSPPPAEKAVLSMIYQFSSAHGFRYGLNENYILEGKVLTATKAQAIDSLFKRRLIFYEKESFAGRDTYWLPTKKGRALVEIEGSGGCLHDYQFSPHCGVDVCRICNDHKGLARCFCGWGLAQGERLGDDPINAY